MCAWNINSFVFSVLLCQYLIVIAYYSFLAAKKATANLIFEEKKSS